MAEAREALTDAVSEGTLTSMDGTISTLRQRTLPHLLQRLGELSQGHEALVASDGRATYGSLLEDVRSLAAGLRARGVQSGDNVGVLLPNGLRWLTGVLAAQWLGATAVPFNTFYRQSELDYIARSTRLRCIIAERVIFDHDFERDLDALDLVAPTGSFVGTMFWERGKDAPEGLAAVPPMLTLPEVREETQAFILFTSGSTAEPKAIPLVHGLLLANGYAIGRRLRVSAADRLWLASPMFFIYGCGHALPVVMSHGATLCLQERFERDDAIRFISAERCTVYYGLPVTTHALVAALPQAREALSSLRTGIAAATSEERRLVIQELGIGEACSAWGMSETYGPVTMTDARDPVELRLTTEGTVLPTQQVRVIHENGGRAATGEIGEIQARGCVISGYVGASTPQTESFTPDGWFRTGDLGWLDERGQMHFVGRSKEIIKAKGTNISPPEVEATLEKHPGVAQAFVVGTPDPVQGELLEAVVVHVDRTVPADQGALAREVQDWMKLQVAAYKVPARITFVAADDLPLTSTGKVSKRLLREHLMQSHLSALPSGSAVSPQEKKS